MNKKAKIVFFCMIFVAKGVFCQNITDKITSVNAFYSFNPGSKEPKDLNTGKNFHKKFNKKPVPVVSNNSGIPLNPFSIPVIRVDHYSRNFGFFCKKELQLEKITKLPFKFRLGSVQYCDWMEGKPNAKNPL